MHVNTCKYLVTRLGAQKFLHAQLHSLRLEDLRTKVKYVQCNFHSFVFQVFQNCLKITLNQEINY